MTLTGHHHRRVDDPHGRRNICDTATIIENGYLEVENDFILGVHKGTPREKSIDHGPGVFTPPLVNDHLHLELSALKNSLPSDKGFKFWVKTLLEKADVCFFNLS